MTNNQTYQQIQDVLKANHFLSAEHILVGGKGKQIIGIQIDCPPILRDDKIRRVKEVLSGYKVSVEWVNNADYILVELKK